MNFLDKLRKLKLLLIATLYQYKINQNIVPKTKPPFHLKKKKRKDQQRLISLMSYSHKCKMTENQVHVEILNNKIIKKQILTAHGSSAVVVHQGLTHPATASGFTPATTQLLQRRRTTRFQKIQSQATATATARFQTIASRLITTAPFVLLALFDFWSWWWDSFLIGRGRRRRSRGKGNRWQKQPEKSQKQKWRWSNYYKKAWNIFNEKKKIFFQFLL